MLFMVFIASSYTASEDVLTLMLLLLRLLGFILLDLGPLGLPGCGRWGLGGPRLGRRVGDKLPCTSLLTFPHECIWVRGNTSHMTTP